MLGISFLSTHPNNEVHILVKAMYHLGTIKALCESELYHRIKVISGTSGGR